MSNEQKCFNYFINEMGLNTAGACGILANIKYESGFRPNVYGDGGTSYGICQWHNTRFTNLKNYCSKNKYDYKTIEGQLHFLQYELEHSYKSLLSYIKKVPNTSNGSYEAGYKWCYDFERPANKSVKSVTRGNYAKTYFNKYNTTKKTYTGTFPTLPSRGYFKTGDKGTQVKYLQAFLNWAVGSGLAVDGIIGPKTISAVKSFQKVVGLKQDGLFGKNSLSKAKAYKK